MKNVISAVDFSDEESLRHYYNRCGLSPALTFESSRKFDYKKTTYSLDGIQLCTTHSASGWGFEKQIATDVYFISFTHTGLSAWEMNKIGCLNALQQMCIIDSARLVQGQFSAGTSTDTMMIDARTVHTEFTAMRGYPVMNRIDFEPVLPKASKAWSLINSIATCIKTTFQHDLSVHSPISSSYLKQALLSSIVETIPHNQNLKTHDNPRQNIPRHVSRAIDYMYANSSQPILLADIAANAFTSIRNLQIGFSKYKETTPMRYLRMIRLANARSDLLSIDINLSWQDIAAKWGFTDTMLFAKYYQQYYHETPYRTAYNAKGKF